MDANSTHSDDTRREESPPKKITPHEIARRLEQFTDPRDLEGDTFYDLVKFIGAKPPFTSASGGDVPHILAAGELPGYFYALKNILPHLPHTTNRVTAIVRANIAMGNGFDFDQERAQGYGIPNVISYFTVENSTKGGEHYYTEADHGYIIIQFEMEPVSRAPNQGQAPMRRGVNAFRVRTVYSGDRGDTSLSILYYNQAYEQFQSANSAVGEVLYDSLPEGQEGSLRKPIHVRSQIEDASFGWLFCLCFLREELRRNKSMLARQDLTEDDWNFRPPHEWKDKKWLVEILREVRSGII